MAAKKQTAKKATTKKASTKKASTKKASTKKAQTRAKGGSKATDAPTGAKGGVSAQGAAGAGKEATEAKDATRANDSGKTAKEPKAGSGKKMSGLDAAAKVLGEAKEPLSTKEMTERALAAGYWSTSGRTPWATLYSAILREIQKKGSEARFEKVERGKFQLKQ